MCIMHIIRVDFKLGVFMQKGAVKRTIVTLGMVIALSACGGGGGGSDDSSRNQLQASGRYKGDLYLSADTCQHSGIVDTLPYEMNIEPTNLTSGPSHVVDVIGDNLSSVNAYNDGVTTTYANVYNSNLSNFFANYNCSENITLSMWSPDEGLGSSSVIRVERISYIYCVGTKNPNDTRTCDVYYIGEMQIQP
jgi:hypothetical protein